MLIATAAVDSCDRGALADRPHVPPLSQVWQVARGALPAVITATVIPLILFYSLSAATDMRLGIVGSLTWSYLVLGRQLLTSRRISGLLIITATTLTIRCVAYAVHQSPFTYFVVPIVDTVAISVLFIVSLALGRPLLVGLARDFFPALGDGLSHVTHRILVRRLSCLWGLTYLGSAATSATLLSTQTIHWYPLLHQLSGWAWVALGMSVTFVYGRPHARELFTPFSVIS